MAKTTKTIRQLAWATFDSALITPSEPGAA